uniref:ADAM family mig-17 (inferred by orthology to a C. elegans protein) n=1 Tax=Strongyloides venezuelensis TaxID=75913 RepID=A0A0K0FVN9_STRVS
MKFYLLCLYFIFLRIIDGEDSVRSENNTSHTYIYIDKKVQLGDYIFNKKIPIKQISTESQKLEEQTIMDLLIVTDYKMYEAFLELVNYDDISAEKMLKDYIKGIFSQLRSIYWRFVFLKDIRIDMNLVSEIIVTNITDCPIYTGLKRLKNEEEGSGEEDRIIDGSGDILIDGSGFEEGSGLDFEFVKVSKKNGRPRVLEKDEVYGIDAVEMFNDWINSKIDVLPQHDHALLLTRYDLVSPMGDSLTQGMANIGCMCKKGLSTSIVEDTGSTSALIAAHEIAHTLGADHDGYGDHNKKCDKKLNHLMSPSVSSSEDDSTFNNIYTISECTRTDIDKFFNDTAKSACLRKLRPGKKRVFNEMEERERKDEMLKAGELFSRDKQCKLSFGIEYGYCKNDAYYPKDKDSCRRIWCSRENKDLSYPCETRVFFPAMDGTECGLGNWCISGKCIRNEKYYKYICVDENKGVCSKYPATILRTHCRAPLFKNICCGTCDLVERKFEKKKNKGRFIYQNKTDKYL